VTGKPNYSAETWVLTLVFPSTWFMGLIKWHLSNSSCLLSHN